MELFVVLLLSCGVWAYKDSSNTSVSFRSKVSSEVVQDWYWVRYNGKIPIDAIDAGDMRNPQSIGDLFIGQGYVEDIGLLPGPLHAGLCELQVCENWKIHTLYSNIMILCAKRKLNVRWIKINIAQLPWLQAIPGIQLIDGGFQHKVKVYIGRHIHDGVRLVGKVYPTVGLGLVNKNKIICVFKNFEILVYIPVEYNEYDSC